MTNDNEAEAAPTSTINQPPDGKRARPSSSSSSSLATFLQRDIDPHEGHRLLLPILTTMDLLHLSECSQGLRDYRYHLGKVKVVPHLLPTPGNMRGLSQLLMDQRQLEYLSVGHKSVLNVLDLASMGWFERLKILDLSHMIEYDKEPDAEDVGYVTRALRGGGLCGLVEINLSRWPTAAVEVVLSPLKAWVCPQLRRPRLAKDICTSGPGIAVAETLETGYLRQLEVLDLSKNDLSQGDGGKPIARALHKGMCPQLIKLILTGCGLSREAGQLLGEAMQSGSCVKLECLDLGFNYLMSDDGFMAIFGALEAGSCPSLKSLCLDSAFLPVRSATALGHALRSGNCHNLQGLDLQHAFRDRDASLRVLQAIQHGGRKAIPNLLHLNITGTFMNPEHGRVLGEAIGGGVLPGLEELWTGEDDESLGDEGVVPIMAALEGGGCRHLKELLVKKVGMGPQGGHALARVLASGHVSRLQWLLVDNNEGIGDEAMADLVQGLRRCSRLRKICVERTGMGFMAAHALIQALQDKAWPVLEEIQASYNEDLLSGDGVLDRLVKVLAELSPPLKLFGFKESGWPRKEIQGAE